MARRKKKKIGLFGALIGLVCFPVALTLAVSKDWAKKHHEYPYDRKRRRRK